MKPFFRTITAMMLLLSHAAWASEGSAGTTLQSVVEQQRRIAAQLADGSLKLQADRRKAVQHAQGEVFAIADGNHVLADLTVVEKTRLENALERIDAAIKGERRAEETAQVCWRERKVGTKLMTTHCGTREEIEAAREGARGFMQRPRTCVASETASCGQ